MRTTDEIIARIKYLAKNVKQDTFASQRKTLADFVAYDDLKEIVDVKEPDKGWMPEPRSDKHVRKLIHTYMPAAWDRANSGKVLPASISLSVLSGFLYMLGVERPFENVPHSFQCKPHFRLICETLGIEWKVWDNGIWIPDALIKGKIKKYYFPKEVAALSYKLELPDETV